MSSLSSFDTFFLWLLKASWQAAVLVLVLLLVRRFTSTALSPVWRYSLWFLLLCRLCMPIVPESPLSLFNYSGLNDNAFHIGASLFGSKPNPQVSGAEVSVSGGTVQRQAARKPTFAMVEYSHDRADVIVAGEYAFPKRTVPLVFLRLAELIWLAGLVFYGRGLWRNSRRLRADLREATPVTDLAAVRLFARCCQVTGLRRTIPLLESPDVQGPAIAGLFRPRLLFPCNMVKQMSESELRMIFLHELAHLRRFDVPINWVSVLFQLVHWFNPVLWLGFKCMRTDREVAADYAALQHTIPGERKVYGRTIIRLLEGFRPAPLSGSYVGLLEDDEQFKVRIQMISRYRGVGMGERGPLFGFGVVAAIFILCLTDRTSARAPLPVDAIAATASPIIASADVDTATDANETVASVSERGLVGDALALAASTVDKLSNFVELKADDVLTIGGGSVSEDVVAYLSDYGTWSVHAVHGRIWKPNAAKVEPNWQPYCNQGRWLVTNEGPYWKSNYVWGMVPFHYGRWERDSRDGLWAWVPGNDWRAAPVEWRTTQHYVGWAPASSSARGSVSPGRFVFVPKAEVFAGDVAGREVGAAWRQRLLDQSEPLKSGSAILAALGGSAANVAASSQLSIVRGSTQQKHYQFLELLDEGRRVLVIGQPRVKSPERELLMASE